jgi:transcription antitermination factor NusG
MSVLQVQETESEKTLYRAAHGHSDGDRMTEQDLNHNWFAVCTRHQHEKTAARILEYKEFEVFLPLYKARHRWKDRIKEVSLPLFPGYLFVREGFKRWLAILTTPGVSSIVSCGGQPAAIPFSEIEGVKRVVESTLRVEPHPFLKSGDWVRVKDGPIAGVEGILLRKKNIARLVLSVEMLGKSAAVEVDAIHVERIPAGAPKTDFTFQDNFIAMRRDVRGSLSTA